MNASFRVALVLLSIVVLVLASHGKSAGDSLPEAEIRASGLAVHWQSQIKADLSRDRISDFYLHVHADRATSYYEIRHAGVRELISFDHLGPRGSVLGKEGAEVQAALRKEILEAEGWTDVTVELIVTPETTLYFLSGFGDVHAINAETGETRWNTRVGNPKYPAGGIAANDTHVIVLMGSRVFCLNGRNGNVEWSRLTRDAPGGGVAISDNFAYITSVGGNLQMFPLGNRGLPEKFFASSGPATMDPTVTGETVSWTTLRGYFNVASSDKTGSLLYRLQTQDRFLAAGEKAGEYLIAATIHGKVYAIHEKDGVIVWELAVGEPVSANPISLTDNRVALISDLGNLMVLDVKRGAFDTEWPHTIPGIRKYIGASHDVIYFLDIAGKLIGLRRDTGSQVVETSVGGKTHVIPNNMTDRLYLTDDSGRLVCLREIANLNPVLHGDDVQVAGTEVEKSGDVAKDNPFAGEAKPADPLDPFASGAMAEEKSSDPDDPFAADSGNVDDPFADNPDDGTPDDPFDDKSGDDPGGDDPGGDDPSDDGGGSGDDPDDPFGGG